MAAHNHEHDHDHEHGEGCGIEKFHIRDLRVREDILAKAEDLAGLIMTSDEVRTFQEAERKISGHKEIQDIISSIKRKQKEIVAFQSFQNEKMVQKIEQEIEELQDKLDQYPIVTEFRQTQEDLNYLLQLIINIVKDTVSDQINVESGTAVSSGGSCSE
ncbi:RicAFT regulatory complex protein RicA family protein [Paenibacillus turpanensis]|uniref:RicAFT regulatory complex protein RicA family protein n=1 Tax=Paenibacillus turpanensis TaxID=2689078 RepID=UPI00140A45B0|nr:YlbF family regulator [Paenibacillus turpanensis]